MLAYNQPEAIKQRFAENYLYFVAEESSSPLGILGIREYKEKPNHLYHLFVDKQYRNQGIARKLWKHYLSQRSENFKNPVYVVNSSLMAVGVYKNFGFVSNGETYEKNHIPCVPLILNINNEN
jgi:predicted GNAT family N-acyltransferase